MLRLIKQEFKNLRSPLYRNSLYISASSLTTAIAGFIFWNVAARLYPAGEVGVASALVSALNLVFAISMLGLNFSLIRFYPEYKERAVGSSLIVALTASAMVSAGYVLIMGESSSLGDIFSIDFLLLFVLFSMAGTAYNVLSTYAIAKRKAEHSFIQSVLFALRFLFLFVFVSFGALGVMSSFGLGLILGVLYGLFAIDGIRLKIDVEYLKSSLKFSIGNYIASLANSAPNYLMPTLILTMLGKEETAYFYVAFAVGNLILFIPNAINTSFFVEGSYGLKDMRRTLKKAVAFSYLYLAAAMIFAGLFGGLVLGFFGEGYVNGLDLLRLLVIGGFFVVPVNFLVSVLNIQKMVIEVVGINVLKAVLFLGFSYLLVPKFGIGGVGYAWVITYGILSMLVFLYLKLR